MLSSGVVNVLLMYNVFRVLGPAIDGRPTTPTRQHGAADAEELKFSPEKFAISPYTYTVAEPSTTWDIIEKSDLLAYPSRSPTSSSSSNTNQQIRGPSPDSDMTMIGQPIMSREVLSHNAFITPRRPDPAMTAIRTSPGSVDSLQSLPVPPRMRGHSPNGSVGSSTDLDVAGWLARQSPDGSMPRGTGGGIGGVRYNNNSPPPPVSAVRPTFAGRYGEQSSTTRPARPGLKPLRLSGGSWPGSDSSSSNNRDVRFGVNPRGGQRSA